MNQSQIFILPDGEEIDLSKIESIGELKSVRSKDFASLGYWYFTIFSKTAHQMIYRKVTFIVTRALQK